ncbi:hypothetical protein V6N12_057728 [Hibiscus sabdariffa]|uniref:Uncharacterized protein n=1 Tax=Hibiscus sabdariffa TaxID=183260 RepID=A0ABR2C5Z1_9ROSI
MKKVSWSEEASPSVILADIILYQDEHLSKPHGETKAAAPSFPFIVLSLFLGSSPCTHGCTQLIIPTKTPVMDNRLKSPELRPLWAYSHHLDGRAWPSHVDFRPPI